MAVNNADDSSELLVPHLFGLPLFDTSFLPSALVLFISIYTVLATIGFFIARWIIKQYDKAPPCTYISDHNPSKPFVSASHALDGTNSNSKLQTRLPSYKGPNPFRIKRLSTYERFKIYFFCITWIAFWRLLSFFGCAFALYLISLPVTMCASPNGFIHRQMVKIIRCGIGCSLFLFGFYYITFSESRAMVDTTHPIRVIVANHNTIFDGLVLLWKTNGIVAAKKELSFAPIFGRIMNACRTLWIDRRGKCGRANAKQQIIDHVNDFESPPLIIFPQGTCSNIQTVTSFKTGAYLAKQKVLEVSLNWSKNKHCSFGFVSDVSVLARIVHVGCCQFINYCHVDIYNEHTPTDKERMDIGLFAENSRQMVVRSLNRYNVKPSQPVVATPHSYSDWKLLHQATSANANFDTSHLLMDHIISNLQLRTKTVTYLAEKFNHLDLNQSGWIEYDEFCTAIDRDPNQDSKQLRDLFNVFNTENTSANRIGFDEFLVGVATCFMDDKIEDAVKIMFNANTLETGECISKENVLYTYDKYVDKAKVMDVVGYREWVQRMKLFVQQVFGVERQLNFDTFYERVQNGNHQSMVQHYLQSIITIRLKIKLTKNDFVSKEEAIYINPLTHMVRSTSIQNVQELL
eukprot:961845_1